MFVILPWDVTILSFSPPSLTIYCHSPPASDNTVPPSQFDNIWSFSFRISILSFSLSSLTVYYHSPPAFDNTAPPQPVWQYIVILPLGLTILSLSLPSLTIYCDSPPGPNNIAITPLVRQIVVVFSVWLSDYHLLLHASAPWHLFFWRPFAGFLSEVLWNLPFQRSFSQAVWGPPH